MIKRRYGQLANGTLIVELTEYALFKTLQDLTDVTDEDILKDREEELLEIEADDKLLLEGLEVYKFFSITNDLDLLAAKQITQAQYSNLLAEQKATKELEDSELLQKVTDRENKYLEDIATAKQELIALGITKASVDIIFNN